MEAKDSVELMKFFRLPLSERMSSPIAFGFLISWCLWNYKFLVILFSAAGVTQTFALIGEIAFPDRSSIVFRGFLYPLGSALFFIVWHPILALGVQVYNLVMEKETKRVVAWFERRRIIPLHEQLSLYAEFDRSLAAYKAEYDKVNEELSKQRQYVETMRVQLAQAMERTPSASSATYGEHRLSTDDVTVLASLLFASDGGITLDEIAKIGKLGLSRVDSTLQRLLSYGLIQREKTEDEILYVLTKAGRDISIFETAGRK